MREMEAIQWEKDKKKIEAARRFSQKSKQLADVLTFKTDRTAHFSDIINESHDLVDPRDWEKNFMLSYPLSYQVKKAGIESHVNLAKLKEKHKQERMEKWWWMSQIL